MNQLSLILITTGLVLIFLGLLTMLNGIPLGHLPGDIKVERPNFTVYFPIVTSILLSIGITLLFWIIQKFWR